jgi:acylphosphatase
MDQNQKTHMNITVSGRVQGVGFRYHAREAAHSFGISGYVKNMPNGEVFIEAEGAKEPVEAFCAWCKDGSPRARVDHVEVTEGRVVGYTEFLIR